MEEVLQPHAEEHGPSHDHTGGCLSLASGANMYETWPSSSHSVLPVAESSAFVSDVPGSSRLVSGQSAVTVM